MTTTDTIHIPTLDELFVDPRSLPSPSASVLEIIRRADEPDVAMSDIAELIEGDVAIAVQVLRMANSALYSPSREITTISRALSSLGLRTIKLLALTTSLRSLIPQQSEAIDLGDIRHRMVVTASMARRAALLVHPQQRDEAFVAGLLTGIGPVVLATEAPGAAREVLGTSEVWPDAAREQAVLGFTTDDVTVHLISHWGLPGLFSDAIAHRHESGQFDADADDNLRTLLHLGTLTDPILTDRGAKPNVDLLRSTMSSLAEMTEEDVDQWLIESEEAVADTASMLQFRIPEEKAYADLVLEASQRLVSLQDSLDQQLFETEESVDELAKRNDELETQASTDSLTQLPNRRAFDRRLALVLERPLPGLGLLVVDLDHFKAVNDTHGHSVGDDVLRMIGATLQRQTRGDDFAARFGGEEFMMLIPETTREKLFVIAERLRVSIGDLEVPLPDGTTISVTASVGGAMATDVADISSARSLIEAADAQLYEAKQGGRDRTCLL